MKTDDSAHVRPGLNPSVRLEHLTDDEKVIVERLSKDWYITNGGAQIALSRTSVYR